MALFTQAELTKKTKAQLIDIADEHLELDGKEAKADIIKLLLALGDDSVPESDEEDDDELDDDEELDDEDEEDDELEDEELDDAEEEDEVIEAKPTKRKAAAKTDTPAKTKATKHSDGEATLAAKQVATILGTEAKTLRQFFRSEASTLEPVGSGGRYEFLESDIPQIKEEFEAWRAAHAARGSKRGPGKKSSTPDAVDEIEEVEDIEELEELDEELDDEDLELDDEEED